jgi:hypothetical protein
VVLFFSVLALGQQRKQQIAEHQNTENDHRDPGCFDVEKSLVSHRASPGKGMRGARWKKAIRRSQNNVGSGYGQDGPMSVRHPTQGERCGGGRRSTPEQIMASAAMSSMQMITR